MPLQISTSRIRLDWRLQLPAVILAVAMAVTGTRAQDAGDDARRARLDQILDLNVRDGHVYYRALKSERARLDSYVASLANVRLDTASPQEQVAFWINAYNAVVLKTVVDHYPIPQRSREYPPGSIRQIPGAFERETHRLAGRTVTLDQIEQTVLPPFHDPRVLRARPRRHRRRSFEERSYTPERLEEQLAEAAAECVSRAQCVRFEQAANALEVSSIFSWRRNEFVDAYAERAMNTFAGRTPVERAVLAFIEPRMLNAERDFLKKNEFRMEYLPFDWSLNDLTGRGGR